MKHLTVFEKRVLFLALFVHLVAAWFSIGFHHPDEHFQLIEFANYKLGKTPLDKLPWEFPAEMRPGLQPLMAYLLLKPYYALGFSNPFNFTFLLRMLSGFAALWTAWQFHKAIAPQIKSIYLRNVHLILSVLGWGLVYLHVRFSSENWSAMMFAWAIMALWRSNKASYWLFGIFAGFSFVFRFQAIFMIGGAGLWMIFINKSNWKDIAKVIAGFIFVFGIGLLCERWLYGHWTVSSWAYVFQNVVENKAAQYGVEPWYWYFDQILNLGIPPFSIILLLSIPVMIIYKPRHILTWSMILFLLGHIVVAHKEFRFLFPLMFFFPFYAVVTLEYAGEKLRPYHERKWYINGRKFLQKSFWLTNAVVLLLMITQPASDVVVLNKIFYEKVKTPTVVIYSQGFNPDLRRSYMGAYFFSSPLITGYCIDEVMNDTMKLKGKNIWIFSEHCYKKDDFVFQYGGSFFDSSRTSLVWTRLPSWVYRFNFNDWLDRSNPYTIYQLHDQPVK